jgi:PAS domain S-box-containing protein
LQTTIIESSMIVNTAVVPSLTKPDVIRVLHVDDDASLLEISKKVLIDTGNNFEIHHALSVDEGLKKLEMGNYDVVVSDFEMPLKNGLQFLKELKEQKFEVPFILFTGKGREEIAIQALNLGANGYFNKQGSPVTVYGELAHGIRLTVENSRAKQALRESEKKYRELADSLPDIVFEADINGLLTYVNERAFKISGYSKEDFEKGLNILWFIDSKEKEKAIRNIQKLSSGYNNVESPREYQFVRKDGTTFPALIMTAAKLSKNKVIGLRGLVIDISERKKIEDQLKKNEKHLREIFSNAPIGIATSDSNMHFLKANMKFCNILGYSEDELRKLTFKNITVSRDIQESILNMEKLCSGEIDFFSQEKQYTRKDNVTIEGRVTVSAIRDKKGKPLLFIAQMEDITERKKTQQMLVRSERKLREYSLHLKDMVNIRTIQLKDANERLVKAERFAAIGELAGMIGHDLRNPLAGIKNATYFLKKKGSALSEEQTRSMLETIEKGIDHSDKIINDLLEYAGEIHLKLYAVPVYSVLENILCIIKVPEAVKIINEIPNNIDIRVDQNRIERVFINLIKNAIDAMPNGGIITIKCKQNKENAEIYFADTGTGIPDEVLPKLFNPLFTTKAQGMGFGLAICKRVVEAHGGTITVETARGKGTTFKVTLPIETKMGSGAERIRMNFSESSKKG